MSRALACWLRLAAVAAALPLAGCGAIYGDVCPDVGPAASDEPALRNCTNDFWSARKQRAVLYGGNDTSRLHTGEPPREGQVVDTSALEAPPRKVEPFVGHYGTLRVEYAADPKAVGTDVATLRQAGARRFDPDQTIRIEFSRATIDFVLRQLLAGALGVNYIAPDNLGGSVTFRTEQPIPKSQVLQLVRDILARNGLVMRFYNGVYHIGQPELIGALDANSQAGQTNEFLTRVIQLGGGNAQDMIAVARQLLPPTVQLLPSNVPDKVIIRARTTDMGEVEQTLRSLVSELGDERVAIIPLSQTSPERIALQLNEFLQARVGPGGNRPTVIPLDKQQALLVGAKDIGTLNGIRQLVREMDRDNADEPQLRVIELRHLQAEEIAPRLATLFGTGGTGVVGPTTGATGNGGNGRAGSRGDQAQRQARPPLLPPGQLLSQAQTPLADPDAGSEAAPRFAVPGVGQGGPAGGRQAAAGGGAGLPQPGSPAGLPAAVPAAGGGGDVRIVADPRSNTLMVYSTFATFKRIRDVLRALDTPQSQIVIEAMIVEVELNDLLNHGVQFFLQGPNVAVRTTPDPIPAVGTTPIVAPTGPQGALVSIGANIGAYRADAVLTALQGITKVKVISSPYLTVVDGKTARLVVGDQIPYTVRSQTSQNTGNVTVTQEVEIKDTGIILDVTPRIYTDNSVALRINQQVTTPSPTAQEGNTTPIISVRNVESNVLGQSGRTILLGGLIQDRLEGNESGVPVLRTIPVFGDLFKQRSDRVRRVELLVMLTPRVIRHTSQIEDITRLLRSQLNTRNR